MTRPGAVATARNCSAQEADSEWGLGSCTSEGRANRSGESRLQVSHEKVGNDPQRDSPPSDRPFYLKFERMVRSCLRSGTERAQGMRAGTSRGLEGSIRTGET